MSRARDFADLAGSADAGGLTGRNMLINGAMTISQRGASFTGLSNGDNQYTLDRWKWVETASPPYTMSVEQSSTSPDGFSNSLKVTTTSGGTLASDDLCRVFQGIEAQNLQHLQYGSSGAQSLTLSFYVRSNVTGTYAVHFYQDDGGPRNITRTYTISAADTWQYKKLTIPGDTAGAIDDNNGRGLNIEFILLAGSDFKGTASTTWGSIANARYATGQTVDINTTNDTWFLTGCQLEVGEQATPFEHEPYGVTLQKAKRYYQKVDNIQGQTVHAFNTSDAYVRFPFEMGMRANPSITPVSSGDTLHFAGTAETISGRSVVAVKPEGYLYKITVSSTITAGQAGHYDNNQVNAFKLDAEL